MGSITGNEGIIKLSGEQVIQARSWSIDETGDTAENTVIGSEARTYKKSMVSWSGSLDVFYDLEDIAVDDLTPGAEIDIQLYPDGDGPGSLFYVGLAIITTITNAATFDGMTERSISFQGTGQLIRANYIGTFAGNDICDKPGDIPGECTEPDYRNPSERFDDRTFEEGDFYTISDIVEGVPGHVNLVDEDDMVIRPIQVYDAETIAFRTTTAPGPDGWYLLQRDIIAADVAFDDTGTIIKGENVQEWNEAADAVIQTALKKTGGTMSGNLILDNNILLSGRNGADDDNIDIARTNTLDHVAIGGGANSPQTNIQGAGVSGLTLTAAEITALLPLLLNSSIQIPNNTSFYARNAAGTDNIIVFFVSDTDFVTLGGGVNSTQTIIRAAGVPGVTVTGTAITALLPLLTASYIRLPNNETLRGRNAANDDDITIISVNTLNNIWIGGAENSPSTLIQAAGVIGLILTEITIESLLSHYITAGLILRNNIAVLGLDTAGAAHNVIRLDAANNVLIGPIAGIVGGSNHQVFQNGTIAEEIADTYHRHYRTTTHSRGVLSGAGPQVINFQINSRHHFTATAAAQLSFTAPIAAAAVGNMLIEIVTNGVLVTLPAGIYWPDGEAAVINAGIWIVSLYWNGAAWFATAQEFIAV